MNDYLSAYTGILKFVFFYKKKLQHWALRSFLECVCVFVCVILYLVFDTLSSFYADNIYYINWNWKNKLFSPPKEKLQEQWQLLKKYSCTMFLAIFSRKKLREKKNCDTKNKKKIISCLVIFHSHSILIF